MAKHEFQQNLRPGRAPDLWPTREVAACGHSATARRRKLLPLAADRGIAILVNLPFGAGPFWMRNTIKNVRAGVDDQLPSVAVLEERARLRVHAGADTAAHVASVKGELREAEAEAAKFAKAAK